MRTNIVIDDKLIASAQRVTGIRTKKGVVEEGLKLLVHLNRQGRLRAWRGRLAWEGDLDTMRADDVR